MIPVYYRPSGIAPIGGMALTIVTSAVAIALFAFIYVFALWYIPFIYVNICLTALFGFGLGKIVSFGVQRGKIRNPKMAMVLGIAIGIAAVYAQWAIWATLVYHMGAKHTVLHSERLAYIRTGFGMEDFNHYLTAPEKVWRTMTRVNRHGLWSFGDFEVKGGLLWTVWVLEALIIVILTIVFPRLRAAQPFSEQTDSWMIEESAKKNIPANSTLTQLRQQLEQGNFDALLNVAPIPDNMPGWKITLHRDTQGREHYLHVSFHQPTEKGKVRTTPQPAENQDIEYLLIPGEVYQRIKANLF